MQPALKSQRISVFEKILKFLIGADLAIIALIVIASIVMALFSPAAGIGILLAMPFIAVLCLLFFFELIRSLVTNVIKLIRHQPVNKRDLALGMLVAIIVLVVTLPILFAYIEPLLNPVQ